MNGLCQNYHIIEAFNIQLFKQMKLHTILAGILCIVFATKLRGQYPSSTSYNLGALFGHGRSSGPAVDQSALYGQGTYHTRTNAYAFAFNFTTVSHKKGIRLGPIFSMALGGSSDKFMGKDLGGGWSNTDGVWGKDFGLFVDWKIGASLNYVLPDQQTTFGIRYFNWYQANCFGGTYSNADDAAAIGISANWKKFGLSYSYGSDKIPGVLLNGHAWNSTEIEARYQLKYKEDTKGGMIVGIRSLTQKLMESAQPILYNPNTKGNLVSVFVLFH